MDLMGDKMRQRLRQAHLRLSGHLDLAEPLPPPTGLQARLLPAADLVMMLFYSRSRAGSLRSVRVTFTTIGLCTGVFLGAGGAAGFLILHAIAPLNLILLLLGVVAGLLALAAGTLALYGVLQQRSLSAASAPRSSPPG